MYDAELLNKIGRYLTGHKESLSVAESVTSGQLQAAFSLAENSSIFFQGGITAYNIQQKYRHLHIDPLHAIGCNCISEQIAREMATNVGKLFLSEWGIGITGYAATMPEVGVDELFAYYAIVYKGNVKRSGLIKSKPQPIPEVQHFYVDQSLKEMEQVCRIPMLEVQS